MASKEGPPSLACIGWWYLYTPVSVVPLFVPVYD